MIRKEKDGYHVYAESGRHMGGPYATEAEAKRRIRQIEVFKHLKKGPKK